MLDIFCFGSPNMARMRLLVRPASLLLLATTALALSVGWTAVADPPGGLEVNITRPDGAQRSIVSTEAKADINGRYTLRQANGKTVQIDVVDGVSVYALLAEAEAELEYVSLVLRGPGGESVTLTREQIDDAFPRPPVLYADEAGAVWFLRSPTSSTDVNAADHFQILNSPITIEQVSDELEVEVKASRTRIEPGETIKFTAKAKPSGSYRYDWTFEPGVEEEDVGGSVSHRFERAGTYQVAVGVYVGADKNSDGSDGIKIQVGDPKESEKEQEGPGDNPSPTAPSVGPYQGASDETVPYVPSTPASPPAIPSAKPPTTPDIATGTTVEGNLLADVSDPPPSNILESAAAAAREGKQDDDSAPDGAGVSEAALSVAGVLALLGLGAGIETRGGGLPRWRRPRLRLPRRAA